jgi:hypothetical protein
MAGALAQDNESETELVQSSIPSSPTSCSHWKDSYSPKHEFFRPINAYSTPYAKMARIAITMATAVASTALDFGAAEVGLAEGAAVLESSCKKPTVFAIRLGRINLG